MTIDSIALIKELASEKESLFLAEKRKSAISAVETSGLPGRHLETWKYTDGKGLVKDLSGLAASDDVSAVKELIDTALPVSTESYQLVFLNGVFLKESSATSQDGMFTITPFEEVGDEDRAKIAESEKLSESVYANVNTALHESGVFIHIPNGAVVDKPIVLLNCVSKNASEQMLFPRVFVEAGDNAQADIIEVALGASDVAYGCFNIVEALLGDNTQISYIVVNRHSAEASVFNAIAGEQGRDSTLRTGVFNFGGKVTRNEIYSTLNGENGRSEILGLNVLEEKQHVDNHTVLDHAVPHCESFELVKGVYGDSSKGVFDGTIIVRPDAQKTNAIQSNQSLLLTDKATSNTKPQLKIWADDVKCTHGATVGQLDDNGMFYLRSRGISEPAARAMLIHAFASEVVSEVGLEFLKESLEVLLTEKLDRI